MKKLFLFDIPRKSKIVFESPIEMSDGSAFIIFDNLDGRYSHCTSEKGNVIHLSAMTPLKKVGDHYVFLKEEK